MAKPVSRWSKVSIGAISMGQEIGISAVQLAGLVSTIANDGVWQAPHIVAAPQGGLREVAYHPDSAPPAEQRRVVSNLTAAQMKMMLQQVVLRGTGRKAQLDGFSAAGKTGTAQKVDPSTGAYSRTKYIGSFAGFAPINNPALTVAVILDSAVGLHQGGQVCAPVFQRVMQQALEYLNVSHDIDVKAPRSLLTKVKDSDLDEGSPDRLAAGPDMAVADMPGEKPTAQSAQRAAPVPAAAQPQASLMPASATVVMDVESGGLVVPSLIGKPVRTAVEIAQDTGFEIDVIGEGLAREQAPAPGAHIAPGGRVAVRFAP
jgi:cell division protein FtsI (penicillin-binding protein 3)